MAEQQAKDYRSQLGESGKMRCSVEHRIQGAAWLERILPYNQHEMRLKVAASALLVVDMQRFLLDASSPTFTCGGVASLLNVAFGFAYVATSNAIAAQLTRGLIAEQSGRRED